MEEDVITKAQSLAGKYTVLSKTVEKQKIRVDANSANGFSFSLVVNDSEYILVVGDWHQPFDKQEEALSAFEKCLSGEAQLRVTTSFNIPYQGALEILDSDANKPQVRYVMGSLFGLVLFLFPKRKKVYRNSFIRAS